MSKQYSFIKNRPVARFFYKGDHTHPVRRTIIIIESKDTLLTGYELREGSITRNFKDAPIKSYSRNKIATVGQIDKRRKLRREANMRNTTLTRSYLKELIRYGA
jgi:hypothetical protein